MAAKARSTGAKRARSERASVGTTTAEPSPAIDAQIVFRNFTNATCALLGHPDSPKLLCDAIGDALRDVGNQVGAFDEYPDTEARRILFHVFDFATDAGSEKGERPFTDVFGGLISAVIEYSKHARTPKPTRELMLLLAEQIHADLSEAMEAHGISRKSKTKA